MSTSVSDIISLVIGSGFFVIAWVYGLQRFQGLLPFNPGNVEAVSPDLAFNAAASYASNTNWQATRERQP